MIDQEALERHVRDALSNYHNPSALQVSLLGELLGLGHAPGTTAAARLRETLRDAIEALKPPITLSAERAEWLSYRILWQTFIQSQSRLAVCDDLGLSRSSYYRFRQQGVEAVARVLWERYEQ